jgi:hypothetical protein
VDVLIWGAVSALVGFFFVLSRWLWRVLASCETRESEIENRLGTSLSAQGAGPNRLCVLKVQHVPMESGQWAESAGRTSGGRAPLINLAKRFPVSSVAT